MSAFDAVCERSPLLGEYEGARDRALLLGVTVTVDGPETPDARLMAVQVRATIAAAVTEPENFLVTPRPNRRERRRAAAMTRRRIA